jgi:RNA polymerase sigma factor (sigma-70 family)
MNRLIEHLRRSVLHEGAGRTDGQLLGSFIQHKDNSALAALVRRHGPMVWGVCSRMLRSHQDAEDAFQATFLILVQKAGALPDREMVGNWLYGVAHQTAVKMRALAAKRGVRERQVAVIPEPASAEQYVWNDLEPILDEELARLPEKYRVLIVLCQLEGKTLKEVARQLAIPQGTVASRLATARAMLAKRLSRRGVVLSGALLGAVVSSHASSACLPRAVVASTIKIATLIAGGQGVKGVVTPTVSALITGVTKAMFTSKIKSALALALLVGLALGLGGPRVGQFSGPPAVAQQPQRAALRRTAGSSVHLVLAGRARYAKPPARPSISSWPEGLAAVIADPTYRDGYNYQNPGYLVENVDTFFYGGDTAALNRFLERITKVKGVRVSVAFSKGAGRINRELRAQSVQRQERLGVPLSDYDGPGCSWLMSVTPKDWVRNPEGGTVQAEARVVIFLGSKDLRLEKLQLPVWKP